VRTKIRLQMEQQRMREQHSVLKPEGEIESGPGFEKHYSVQDLAKFWGVSALTVRRIFCREPDVMIIGDRSRRSKRGYKTLRIPESVARRVYKGLLKNGTRKWHS